MDEFVIYHVPREEIPKANKVDMMNGHRLPFVTGKAPVTHKVLQISQKR
jgi:hypothetical protein